MFLEKLPLTNTYEKDGMPIRFPNKCISKKMTPNLCKYIKCDKVMVNYKTNIPKLHLFDR